MEELSARNDMKVLMRKLRVALTPRGWLLKTRLSNGALVYGINRAGYGSRGIYIFRESIEPELQHLQELLDPSGVFVDVGANTGIYTLKAAKYLSQGGGVVVAIEPFPDVFATLFHSVRANRFTNVRLRSLCIGEVTGSAELWMNFIKPNSFGLIKRDERASCISTLTVALDDLFRWERMERLDYLKVDAEGSERQVLAGAKRTIEKHRPIVQAEVSISDITVDLPGYRAFRAPGSPNKVYIPNDHPKSEVPGHLGWAQES